MQFYFEKDIDKHFHFQYKFLYEVHTVVRFVYRGAQMFYDVSWLF